MSDVSLMYWQDQLGKTLPRSLKLHYSITGAKAASPVVASSASLITFDAFASQTVIDNFLGTTNEFLLAAFDATAMGADMFGGLVNMAGQAKQVVGLIARCCSGTDGLTVVTGGVAGSSALTASTLKTEVAVGAEGNIGFKVNFANIPDFDALTAGLIEIEILWISK